MTAVEYIREKLLGDEYWYEGMTFDQIIEQAKAMEKNQIIQARITSPLLASIDKDDYIKEAEQYYKETFKSE